MLAFLGRYAHQSTREMMRLSTRELVKLVKHTAFFVEKEGPKVM